MPKKRVTQQPVKTKEISNKPVPQRTSTPTTTGTQQYSLNSEQKEAMSHIILPDSVVVLMGKAGTGKTWLAIHAAFKMLASKEITKIIVTRPTVDVERSLGYLPGEMEDKFSVYLKPIKQFCDKFGPSYRLGTYEDLVRSGKIEASPLQYMRGETFEGKTFVLLDEGQNATQKEIAMLVTRMGQGSRLVITGDVAQSDLRLDYGEVLGLERLKAAARYCDFITIRELTINERHPRIDQFLNAWGQVESK